MLYFILTLISLGASVFAKGLVTVELEGRFGNQLFQIATAYAYSLDHGLELTIPKLFSEKKWDLPTATQKLLRNRLGNQPFPEFAPTWREPSLRYTPIPAEQTIRLSGYFQSEKYFAHRRKEILELFTPSSLFLKKLVEKYPFFSSKSLLVAVQIRDYSREFPRGFYHPTHRRGYYRKAITYFPPDTTFVVSTDNLRFAKECMEGLSDRIIYLQNKNDFESFWVLSLCDSFIISNSSFGWWAAWLSTRPNKIVIAPKPWLSPPYDENEVADLLPEDWIHLKYE